MINTPFIVSNFFYDRKRWGLGAALFNVRWQIAYAFASLLIREPLRMATNCHCDCTCGDE